MNTNCDHKDSDLCQRFVELYRKCHPAIRGYIYTLLPIASEAEEVVQQTSLVLWRKFPTTKPMREEDFMHWAASVAYNEVRNYRRKLSNDKHVFSCELITQLAGKAESHMRYTEAERKALSNCLGKLKQHQQDLIHRCYSNDTTIKQVADTLGFKASVIYKRLYRLQTLLIRCVRRNLAMERI